LLIAQDQGYFAAERLDVEFTRLASVDLAVPMLIEGRIDAIAGVAVPALLYAMARGERVRAVSEKGSYQTGRCSRMAIMTRPGLLASRRGGSGPPPIRRISVGTQAPIHYLAERTLARAGLRLDDLEVLYVPDAPEIEALAAGTLDAAIVGEPWITRALREDKAELWIAGEDVLRDQAYAFIFYGPTLLERDPDAGRRFLIAYLRGLRRYLEGKTPGNIELLARVTGEAPATLQQSCWPEFDPHGSSDVTTLRDYQDWVLERGLIERIVRDDEFWDGSFIDHANRALAAREPGEQREERP
jgi:NitT/TauT family transport system substrate-binding protein